MHLLLPHVGHRQAYVEVYFTYATAEESVAFAQVMSGNARPAPGNVMEHSAESIRRRVHRVVGENVNLDPFRAPYLSLDDAPYSRCIVTAIVKTPLGVRTSSHVEEIYPNARLSSATTSGTAASRVTVGAYAGEPKRPTDLAKDWSVKARAIEIGQQSTLNLMAFFTHTRGACRELRRTAPIMSFATAPYHDAIMGVGPTIRVLDKSNPELDRAPYVGQDIVTDMELLQAPTVATAFMASSSELVSNAESQASRYAVPDPWD